MDQFRKTARFTFLDELNDFIKDGDVVRSIYCDFRGRQSVKHLIESLHVPHTEVGEIRANDEKVDFNYLVQDRDDVIVFPAKGIGDASQRFLNDNHLGKLATYLRVLGFDVLYNNQFQDDELAQLSNHDCRILLTRDRGLLMRREVRYGYCVRSRIPREQLIEIVNRFELQESIKPFNRCLRCNHVLEAVDKASIMHRLEPLTKKYYDEFHLCLNCDKVYWKGSHYEHMEKLLNEVLDSHSPLP